MEDKITVHIEGYDRNALIDDVARHLVRDNGDDGGGRIADQVERIIDETIRSTIQEIVDARLPEMVEKALTQGVLVSEPFDDQEERRPLDLIVKDAVHAWLKPKQDSYGSRKESPLEALVKKEVDDACKREAEKMLKEVKAETLERARAQIAKTVAERLFDGKAALPF